MGCAYNQRPDGGKVLTRCRIPYRLLEAFHD